MNCTNHKPIVLYPCCHIALIHFRYNVRHLMDDHVNRALTFHGLCNVKVCNAYSMLA